MEAIVTSNWLTATQARSFLQGTVLGDIRFQLWRRERKDQWLQEPEVKVEMVTWNTNLEAKETV